MPPNEIRIERHALERFCKAILESLGFSAAEELGAEIVKLFPGKLLGGPEFVKAVHGPMPWTRIMPTGGIRAEEGVIDAWFESGAAALGMGSSLIGHESAVSGDSRALVERVAQVITWIRSARKEKSA